MNATTTPTTTEGWLAQARSARQQGRLADAVAAQQQAVQGRADSADLWNDLGALQRAAEQPEAALLSLQNALQIDPGHRLATSNFAQALQALERHADAALAFDHLLRIWPDCPYAPGQLMHSKMQACDWTGYDALRSRIEAGIRAGRPVVEPFAAQAFVSDPALLRLCAEIHSHFQHPELRPHSAALRAGPGPRIRLGYVSGEFRNQATMHLLAGVLEAHDRSRFEVIGFDNGFDDGSPLRQRVLAALDRHVPIAELDDQAAAAVVAACGVDILVNLNGHFGRHRNGLFARRAAPVQVNYLGFPGTLGGPHADYLLADRHTVPDVDRAHYTEAVVHLPHSYQPNDAARAIHAAPVSRAEAGLPEAEVAPVVLCCFNTPYKLTPEVFGVWMGLLRQRPGTVLWLYASSADAEQQLRAEAAGQGVDPQRLFFAPHWPLDRHLARLRLASLVLDTWPYNAHTTASDALWAGVPVLTCTGSSWAGRVGASLLHAVGLPELVTRSPAEYVALALRLTGNPAVLAAVRSRLADARDQAPLFDTVRYTRGLEAAYTRMAQASHAGLPPTPFAG